MAKIKKKRVSLIFYDEDTTLLNLYNEYLKKNNIRNESIAIKEIMQIGLLAIGEGYTLEHEPKLVKK